MSFVEEPYKKNNHQNATFNPSSDSLNQDRNNSVMSSGEAKNVESDDHVEQTGTDKQEGPKEPIKMDDPGQHKANWKFLWMFWLFQTLVGFQVAYLISYTNAMSLVVATKYTPDLSDIDEIAKKDKIVKYLTQNTLIVSAAAAGFFIQRGRRLILILAAINGIVGCIFSVIISWPCVLIGQTMFAISCGIIAVTIPRMIEETIPSKLLGLYGGYYAMTFGLAYSFTNIELLIFIDSSDKTKI